MGSAVFAAPDLNKGVTLDVFRMGDRICSLLKDCPPIGAADIPKELRFEFPFTLFLSKPGGEGMGYILPLEISMFGTAAYALIDGDYNRESLGAAERALTARRFIWAALYQLNRKAKIWDEDVLYDLSASMTPTGGSEARLPSDFSFFQKLKFKKRLAAFQGKTQPILELVRPYIQMCHELCVNSLATIKQWSVADETLTTYVAYLRGVVSCAAGSLNDKSKEAQVIENAVMVAIISAQFGTLPLAKYFIEAVENSIANYLVSDGDERYTLALFLLGKDPMTDIKATMKGHNDFVKMANGEPGAFPNGLFDLDLVKGCDSGTANS